MALNLRDDDEFDLAALFVEGSLEFDAGILEEHQYVPLEEDPCLPSLGTTRACAPATTQGPTVCPTKPQDTPTSPQRFIESNRQTLGGGSTMWRQPLPLEEHHVVLKESSKQLTAATEFYGDHVQCMFGRVNCLSVSQVRHLKNLQDAYNRCKLGTDNQDPLPPASFWVRKDKAEKQAKKKGKLSNWTRDLEEEVRYGIIQNKQVYFVQASDDCLRHDVRNSGDPMRGAHRQFKKLMKLFSAVPDKAPSSITSHVVTCPSSSASKTIGGKAAPRIGKLLTIGAASALGKGVGTPGPRGPPHTAMPPPSSSCASSIATSSSIGEASQLSSNPKQKAVPPTPSENQTQELFHINGLANLGQNVNGICNRWLGGSTGVDRIIKEGLVKSFKEDMKHFLSQGLVDAISEMKIDVINSFGNNMLLCYKRLTVKPLVGQNNNKLFQLAGVENLEHRAMEVCKQLITNSSSGINRALRRGLVEAFKEDVQHFHTKGLLAVDSSILVNVINFFGNRMANFCDTEFLNLNETLGIPPIEEIDNPEDEEMHGTMLLAIDE